MKPEILSRTIRVEAEFDASHRLPDYDGPCARLHGHTWRVVAEACFDGAAADQLADGILLDLVVLQQALRDVTDPLDHWHLNDVLPPEFQPPTAELIGLHVATEIVARLRAEAVSPLPDRLRLEVWETPRTCAVTTVACPAS